MLEVRVMPHNGTYLHSKHLRSPFRNLYSHLSPESLYPPSASLGSILPLSIPDPQSSFSLSQQMHDFSKSPAHSDKSPCLGGSLPASILHSRSPLTRTLPFGRFPSSFHSPFPISTLTRTLPFGRFPSSLHSPFPIYHSSHPTLWAVPFQPPFSILRSPIWSLVPDDGARATTFAEAQR